MAGIQVSRGWSLLGDVPRLFPASAGCRQHSVFQPVCGRSAAARPALTGCPPCVCQCPNVPPVKTLVIGLGPTPVPRDLSLAQFYL